MSFELFNQGDMLNAISGYMHDATDCPQRQRNNHRRDFYQKYLFDLGRNSFDYAQKLKEIHATNKLTPQTFWGALRQCCFWHERSFGQKFTLYKDGSTRYSGTTTNKDEFIEKAKTLLDAFKEMQEERALCFKPLTKA